jgi:hypothetical protein
MLLQLADVATICARVDAEPNTNHGFLSIHFVARMVVNPLPIHLSSWSVEPIAEKNIVSWRQKTLILDHKGKWCILYHDNYN